MSLYAQGSRGGPSSKQQPKPLPPIANDTQPTGTPRGANLAASQQRLGKSDPLSSFTTGGSSAVVDWGRVSFAEIPTEHLNHVLTEVLKGMLWVDVSVQSKQLQEQQALKQGRTIAASPREAAVQQSTSRVTFEPEESGPFAKDSEAFGPTMQLANAKKRSNMYSRLMTAYSSVMATYASDTSKLADEDTSSAADSSRQSSRQPPIGAITFGGSRSGGSDPSTDWISKQAERRLQQMEKLLVDQKEENADLKQQLEDLDNAHGHVQTELTRAYKQYDQLQRRLIDLTEEQRAREQQQRQQQQQQQPSTPPKKPQPPLQAKVSTPAVQPSAHITAL